MNCHDIDVAIELELLETGYEISKETFRAMLVGNYRHSISVDFQGRMVGYCLFDSLPTTIQIHRLNVHPDYRRRGAGKEMINRLRSMLSYRKQRFISAWVLAESLDACLFYQRSLFMPQPQQGDWIPFVYRYHPEADGGMSTLVAECKGLRSDRRGDKI